MNVTPAAVGMLGALAVLAFVLALWLPAYGRARVVRRRLAGIGADGALASDRGGQHRATGYVNLPSLRATGRFGWLEEAISRAEIDLSVGEVLVGACVIAVSAAGLAYVMWWDLRIAVASAVAGTTVPFFWIGWEQRRRRARLVAQLPETTRMLASLVRGGNTFLQAIEHVARESDEPMRSALGSVVREIGLGASQDSALERLAQRFPSDDLVLLVAAVSVHQQVGGSLSVVLDQIAQTLRERVRLQGEIRTLTAAQRLSAYVLAGLPVIVGIFRSITDPESFRLFFTVDYLRIALIVAALMVLVGSIAMRRIASIDV